MRSTKVLPLAEIHELKIHPGMGIARVGNSPKEFYVGPEIPDTHWPVVGGFKDSGEPDKNVPPRIKRQAARFRIFAYDKAGKLIDEVTTKDAQITWTVELANKKAEWDRFEGMDGEKEAFDPTPKDRRPGKRRNSRVDDRGSLMICPGPRTVAGPNAHAQRFDTGRFRHVVVALGDIATDESGRLLVRGGFGKSGCTDPNQPIVSYANNDFWYDDTSDGPVTAKVLFKGKSDVEFDALAAWVIVSPPDFAPAVDNVVTLYDVAFDTAIRGGLLSALAIPSFTQHIYPILKRATDMQWVQLEILNAHGPKGSPGFDFASAMEKLSSANVSDPDCSAARNTVFRAIRNPRQKQSAQANRRFMPALSGDSGDTAVGDVDKWLYLTETQYDCMEKWAKGNFKPDWTPTVGAEPNPQVTPDGLDRASLEASSGGAFYPGIEAGWVLRNPKAYIEPFRLDAKLFKAGDITKRMACPWQADFYECNTHWWPAQRPDEVLTSNSYDQILFLDQEIEALPNDDPTRPEKVAQRETLWRGRNSWARGLPDNSIAMPPLSGGKYGDEAMVNSWHRHGFVVAKPGIHKDTQFVETERGQYENLSMAEYFHYLVDIEDHPDFVPEAKRLARRFLDQEFRDPGSFEEGHFDYFDYTEAAFDARMQKIYNDYVVDMYKPLPLDSGEITWPVAYGYRGDETLIDSKSFSVGRFSDTCAHERLKQMAPFNLVDGAWLQKILSTGPCDEVQARLFSIWSDEAGNGKTDLNHCNVYATLLQSLNIYMPPIKDREFIEQDFLPGAFTQPVLQLCVGLFPEEFYPELLGMTLYLEWEATPTLTPIVKCYEGRRIDPHFYRMHVAIDNVSVGHGALAKEAIKLYLENQNSNAVQDIWKRIWNGYVTWATAGQIGAELLVRQLILDRKQIDISSPVFLTEEMFPTEKEHVESLTGSIRLLNKLKVAADPISQFIVSKFDLKTKDELKQYPGSGDVAEALQRLLCRELNKLLLMNLWECTTAFRDLKTIPPGTQKVAASNPTKLALSEVNRQLMQYGYPTDICSPLPKWFPNFREYYESKMQDLISKKAPIARPVHRQKSIAGYNLMTLFDDPDTLMTALQSAGYVDPEHPRSSKFLQLLDFSGPMYKVFTPEEVGTILDWVESLRPEPERESDPAQSQESVARMFTLITAKSGAASGNPHHAAIGLSDPNGSARSIAAWFDDPLGLMQALVRNGWVVPANTNDSMFVTLISGNGPMAPYFSDADRNVVINWIIGGANLPSLLPPAQPELAAALVSSELLGAVESVRTITSTADSISEFIDRARGPSLPPPRKRPGFAERRRLIGMGAVH